jgi:hypothetical protein
MAGRPQVMAFLLATQEGSMANDHRIDSAELAQIARLAHEGLHGGLLEQPCC